MIYMFCYWCFSSASLYRHEGGHLRWKGVCYSTKYSMSTMGLPASSCTQVYWPILVSGFIANRRCKLLPGFGWRLYSVVFHNNSSAALGLLRHQDHILGYANKCIVNHNDQCFSHTQEEKAFDAFYNSFDFICREQNIEFCCWQDSMYTHI